MNAKTLSLFVLFVLFSVVCVAVEIPGGIVYSDGKDAIYYDFKKGEKKNLTSDFSNTRIDKDSFAVSDNGQFLLWLQDGKFYVRELPAGTPRVIKVNRFTYKSSSRDDIIEDVVWQNGAIKNLSLSPDGARFSFDAVCREPGWVYTGKNVGGVVEKQLMPFYAKRIDSYNGIFYLSTIFNRAHFPIANPLAVGGIGMDQFSRPLYGNIVELPPVPRFRASWQDLNPHRKFDPSISDFSGRGGEDANLKSIFFARTVKKNAHYLAFKNWENWKQDRKLAAFIFQIGDQWGPIELKVLDSKKLHDSSEEWWQGRITYHGEMPKHLQKCREWEILVSCKACEGLFWKPDGGLSIMSGGDLYLIDADQIQKGMNESGVNKKMKAGNVVNVLPINNVFKAEPRIIAKDINSSYISWLSDDAFLFLRKDMSVCLWDNGKIENILYSPIPSRFCYCSYSPFDGVKDINSFVAKGKSNDPLAITGANRTAVEGTANILSAPGQTDNAKINFGPIQTMWRDIRRNDSLCIYLKIPRQEQKPLEFVLIENEDNLNNIADPSQYEYLSEQKQKTADNLNNGMKIRDDVLVYLNDIIILKLDTAYVAIKPISLRLKYSSVKEVPKWAKDSWAEYIKAGEVPPFHDLMTYEWKYWPSVESSDKVVKSSGKNYEKTLISKAKKDGWEVSKVHPLEKFSIGDIKFSWKMGDPEDERNPLSLYFDRKNQTIPIKSVEKEGYRKYPKGKEKPYEDIGEDIMEKITEEKIFVYKNDPYPHRFYREWSVSWSCAWEQKGDPRMTFLRINKDNYIAIKPLFKDSDGSVVYKWKYWRWPEDPKTELTVTTLSKK